MAGMRLCILRQARIVTQLQQSKEKQTMGEDIRFDGRVAIVTGAGAGLGKTYALELAKRGAEVIVNDLGGARDGSGEGSSNAADLVVDEIKSAGGEATANYDNVASSEGGEGIVQTAIDAYGKVDILINNAGILRDKSFLKMEPENWDAVMAVHLRGSYCVSRPAFRNMRENAYGRIIMTSSGSGLFGNFGQSNYGAAKTGVVGLMNVLSLEGRKYNITTNTIAPFAGTRLTEDVTTPEVYEASKPEFVTPGVLYMVSEECKDSCVILHGGAGNFFRVAIVAGPPKVMGDGKTPAAVEDIRNRWDEIMSIEGGEERRVPSASTGTLIRPS